MDKEIEKLQVILQKDPSNFQARRELSILLARNGFNEEAISNLQYLSKYFPEDSEIWYNLGILQEKLKQPEKAKDSYLKAIEISAQDDYLYNLGEVLVELKEWDDAIVAFKSVLKNDPNDGNCYFNLGVCYMNKDEINSVCSYDTNYKRTHTLDKEYEKLFKSRKYLDGKRLPSNMYTRIYKG